MNFTFGIITTGDPEACDRINAISASIAAQVPSENYEVIVVGNPHIPLTGANLRVIPFDEAAKRAWITKKKNIVTDAARFPDVVYMHDYFVLEPGWYEGWKKFGDNYHAAMNCIINPGGDRYRDWTLWIHDEVKAAIAFAGLEPHLCGIPYDIDDLYRFQYFSGGYWVAKKELMTRIRLDESRGWGEGEDVDWSIRWTRHAGLTFKMNAMSTVKIIKPPKGAILQEMPREKAPIVRARLLGL